MAVRVMHMLDARPGGVKGVCIVDNGEWGAA